MATFTGLLSIIGHQSNLDEGATDWLLLMAGISDPAQATFAATQFLVKAKKLHSGQMISVEGSSGTIGTVSIISMTEASAAGPQEGFEASFASAKPGALVSAGSGKKGSKKKKPGGTSKSGVTKGAKKGTKKSSGKAAVK